MNLVATPVTAARLRRWEKLPPFHPVALKLMRVTASDNVSLAEVAGIIRCDAAFAAEILRLANSPLFGFHRQVDGVLQAIGLLGTERVRGLALTVALRRFLGHLPPLAAVRICWRHNLACAMIAEELAASALMPSDTASTAGLVHDLGRLALLASDPDGYSSLLERAEDEPSRICDFEREIFGLDHCQAGAELMNFWSFPPALCEIAAAHHNPVDGERLELLEAVQLACWLADSLGFQVAGPPPPFPAAELAWWLPPSAVSRFEADPEAMATWIAIKINSFEVCG
jgi:putative nucleotidyltransferase with HDIG domain